MNYLIRKANPTDIIEIVRLCEEHAEYEQAEYISDGKADRLLKYIFSDEAPLYCLIVENESGIIGYATYMFEFSTWDARFYTHMDCLYIRTAYRNNGIGLALINEIATQSHLKGINLIQWQTPISNERAIKFYHRIGAISKPKLRLFYYC